MKTRIRRPFLSRRWTLPLAALLLAAGTATAEVPGLDAGAIEELRQAGVDKYLGTPESTLSEYGVWVRHAFNPRYTPDARYPAGARPDGPVCIAGTPYSVFTRGGDPKKLLIFLQGGGDNDVNDPGFPLGPRASPAPATSRALRSPSGPRPAPAA